MTPACNAAMSASYDTGSINCAILSFQMQSLTANGIGKKGSNGLTNGI